MLRSDVDDRYDLRNRTGITRRIQKFHVKSSRASHQSCGKGRSAMTTCEWITKELKLGPHCCDPDSETVKENNKQFIDNELIHSNREV